MSERASGQSASSQTGLDALLNFCHPPIPKISNSCSLRFMKTSTQHRLRKHPDYQRVYGSGRKQWARQIAYFSSVRSPGSVAAMRSETAGPRVGLTVPKALGKAVDRNRIKRRLRAIIRTALPLLHGLPVDIILHPKRSVLEADFPTLEREVAQIFRSVHAKAKQATATASSGAPLQL